MNTLLPKYACIVAIACCLFTGCTTKRVVFATKSQLGLDVSGTAQMPDKISFTYGRYEGAIVPRSSQGNAYSVYGALDADVKFFGDSTIEQIFTTGQAATLAATGAKGLPTDPLPGEQFTTKQLFFVTDTSYGLKLSAGKQDISPTLMMGYKRIEGAVIPVDEHEKEVRSVYADILINSSTDPLVAASGDAPMPRNRGVRIVQRFATGNAAVAAAGNSRIQRGLKEKVSPQSEQEAIRIESQATDARVKIIEAVAPGGVADPSKRVDQTLLQKLADQTPVFETPLMKGPPATAGELSKRLQELGLEAASEIAGGLGK